MNGRATAIEAAKRHQEKTGERTVAYPAKDGLWTAVPRDVYDERSVYSPHDGMKEAVFFPAVG